MDLFPYYNPLLSASPFQSDPPSLNITPILDKNSRVNRQPPLWGSDVTNLVQYVYVTHANLSSSMALA